MQTKTTEMTQVASEYEEKQAEINEVRTNEIKMMLLIAVISVVDLFTFQQT